MGKGREALKLKLEQVRTDKLRKEEVLKQATSEYLTLLEEETDLVDDLRTLERS